MKKLILLSGGMDSATALAQELAMGFEVACIAFNYGSKHNNVEYRHAEMLCAHYQTFISRVDLGFVGKYFKSDLLQSGGDIPDGHYEDESMKRTVVPFRNGIMLAIAVGIAESHGYGSIVLSNHAGDHAIYPDCRAVFIEAMANAVRHGSDYKVDLESPFVAMTKTQIAMHGHSLGVPYELTWSCYKGGEKHCGTCGTCNERKEAFRDSGVQDPTEYLA